MDKQEFLEMGDNPDFISGIYNYCDRWCKRCGYTSRCFLFATEKKQFPDDESRDINNQKFWKGIEDMFRLTFELLEDAAEEFGVDLDQMDEISAEEFEQSEAEKRATAEKHPSARKAHAYLMQVRAWFEESNDIFEEKGEELAKMAELELPEEDIEKEVAGLEDYVEIIRWYQHQIYVKIMRALQGKMDGLFQYEDTIQTDYNGSAKVALLGIDRSIAAWGGLLQTFPDQEDEILQLLVLLEQIRKQTEAEFPDARKFIRPGFDE